MSIRHENVNVEFEERRWKTFIKVTDAKTGEPIETYVASADGADTDGSGIWFGTEQQYEEDRDW